MDRLHQLQAQVESEGNNPQIRTQQDLKWTYTRIALAGQRDRIASSRPEGCLCLGLGQFWEGTRTILCSCPEGENEKARLKAVKVEQRLRQIDLQWEKAEIPNRFFSYTLESSPLLASESSLKKALKDSLEDIPSPSWYFWGDFNIGKTGLAVGYAWAWLEANNSSLLFRTLPRLASELRSTYSRRADSDAPTEEQVLERYRAAGLLILDDLGAEQVTGSGWLQDRLYQIIGERHDDELSIVFTSNLSLDDVAARVGERITWRILEMCGKDRVVHLIGRNLRA